MPGRQFITAHEAGRKGEPLGKIKCLLEDAGHLGRRRRMQSTVGGVVSLDADQVELVLHHGRSNRLEGVVGEQVVKIALVGEFETVVGEECLNQKLGEGAELHQASRRIAVDVGFCETAEIGEFAVIFPEKFEVTRFHKGNGCRRETKPFRGHDGHRSGFGWGEFGTHFRAVRFCSRRAIGRNGKQRIGLQSLGS